MAEITAWETIFPPDSCYCEQGSALPKDGADLARLAMMQISDAVTLDSERLLSEWRWLCPQPVTVIGRNAFGDLFVKDEAGKVHLLNVGSGQFCMIAASISEFAELAKEP